MDELSRRVEKELTFATRFGRWGLPSAEEMGLVGLPEPTEPQVLTFNPLEVEVREGRLDKALRLLKKKMAAEGVLKEIKKRRRYLKPSAKRRKKQAEAARQRRKHKRSG